MIYFDVLFINVQVENILMDENSTYVLCDFGSATAKFWNPKKHSVKDIDEELSRLLS